MLFGRRVRRLSRASQDRVADSSAIAAEVLNAIPVVQSYAAESARGRALRRLHRQRLPHRRAPHPGARACWWPSSSSPPAALMLWGLYQGTQAVLRGDITAGHLGQTVLYVIILAGAVGGAGRGLRRPAARRRRHRAADGAAGQPLAGRARRRSRCRRRRRRRAARVSFERRALPLSVAARARRRWRDFSLAVRARRDGGAGRPQRRRQDHGVPAAAALLRPAAGPHPPRRRAGRAQPALHDLRARIGAGAAGRGDLLGRRAGEHPLRPARAPATTKCMPRRAAAFARRFHHAPCPRATTPSSASAACACRAASASASRSRARC